MNSYKRSFIKLAIDYYQRAKDQLISVQSIVHGTYFIPEVAEIKVLKRDIAGLCKDILFDLSHMERELEDSEVTQNGVFKPQCPKCGWSISKIEQARRYIYTNTMVCKVCGHKWEVAQNGS